MRMHGTVRGGSIDLREPPGLPDGVEVEVEIVPTQSKDASVEDLSAFRARLLQRWGRPMDLSTQIIREDRER